MNPKDMFTLKKKLDTFNSEHPKVQPFLAASASMLEVGTVIEMKVTNPDGREIVSNIRLTPDDVETLRGLMSAGR